MILMVTQKKLLIHSHSSYHNNIKLITLFAIVITLLIVIKWKATQYRGKMQLLDFDLIVIVYATKNYKSRTNGGTIIDRHRFCWPSEQQAASSNTLWCGAKNYKHCIDFFFFLTKNFFLCNKKHHRKGNYCVFM